MKTVTINFSNFWGEDSSFTPEYFYKCFPFLRDRYDLKLADDPDVMIYSVYDYVRKLAPNSKRLVISGECGDHFAEGGKMSPGHSLPGFYHYGLTMAIENKHPDHCYMPLPYLHLNLYNQGVETLVRKPGDLPPKKKHFCDFIYSNPNSQDRIRFMEMLLKYKEIICAGAVGRNNSSIHNNAYNKQGYLDKQKLQSKCKFSIAFENNYFPGYTSEKLSDPFVGRSVPIYSGNPKVNKIFNPEAFINVDSFKSYEEAIAYIEYVDCTPAVYEKILNEPPFVDNRVPDFMTDKTYADFFGKVFA